MIGRGIEASPQVHARIAGAFYLGTIVAGALAMTPAVGSAANLIATAFYVAVTLLFYKVFEPVNRNLSLVAALIGFTGCALGVCSLEVATPINPLVLFGFYCFLIGFLILKSTFLPRILGVLMAFGGLGWLTFVSPPLAKTLFPYNMIPGILGETALTLWLLVKGVNVPHWKEQAGVGRAA